jgi:hypothetical protein
MAQSIQTATIGQLLAAAAIRFQQTGGYYAVAHCETGRVDLHYQEPGGAQREVSSAPLPEGIAPEDIASDLLAAEIGREAAEDRHFEIAFRNS